MKTVIGETTVGTTKVYIDKHGHVIIEDRDEIYQYFLDPHTGELDEVIRLLQKAKEALF